MVNGKPTFISLFAGCGGSSLGYKWAGYRELLAIDFDKNAVETFELNFPDVSCWQKDIKEVTGQEILDFCGIKKGELFLLDASPPCQGFSTAGKRKVSDSRNDLFLEFVRLIKELEPQVFVMENVSGLIKGKMKGLFIEIMKELKSLPYQVKCKLMNAMYYGVPQSRRRLIWVGIKEDLKVSISYPEPHKKIISVREAIGKDGFIEYRHNYSKGKVSLKKSSFKKPCLTITKSGLGWKVFKEGSWGKKAWDTLKPGESLSKYDTDFCKGKSGHGIAKVNPRKPCPTIRKDPSYSSAALMHWEEPRSLSIDEIKILSSFPDNFQTEGSFREQWAAIGNSVPPKFMEAIARQIRATVEYG